MDRPHGTNRGKIIEGEDCGEAPAGSEQLLGGVISEVGRGEIVLELNHQFRRNRPAGLLGYLGDHLPANFAVRGKGLPLDDGDVRVSEPPQVLKGKFSGSAMIEDDARGSPYMVMAGNRHHRYRK